MCIYIICVYIICIIIIIMITMIKLSSAPSLPRAGGLGVRRAGVPAVLRRPGGALLVDQASHAGVRHALAIVMVVVIEIVIIVTI